MTNPVRVKICGLSTAETIEVAADEGAAYVGFVFFEKSPRNVSIELAARLSMIPPVGVAKVGLFVNPDNALLDEVLDRVALDMLQLHGHETPGRLDELRDRYGLPMMKAVGISSDADMSAVETYGEVADQILVDTKAPKGADLPGGNGETFDWSILARHKYWSKPWMLAGGLTPQNVRRALHVTGARQIDLSSGVESAPGVKSPEKIREFFQAVRDAA